LIEILRIVAFALVALFVLVTVHEFGHYWVARRCGVRVLRFSIGFGKPLLKYRKGDTEFVFAGIPLGGYVKMFGETNQEEEPVPDDQKQFSFSHKSVWQRMAIVVAGPLANMILAVFLYFLVYLGGLSGIAPLVGEIRQNTPAAEAGLQAGVEIVAVDGESVSSWTMVFDKLIRRIGETGSIELSVLEPDSDRISNYALPIVRWESDTAAPDILNSLGIQPLRPDIQAVVGEVVPGSAAAEAGFLAGDEVITVDGAAMADWESWRQYIRSHPGQPISTRVNRDGISLELVLVPEAVEEEGAQIGRAGIAPQVPEWPQDMMREVHYGVLGSIQQAGIKTWDTGGLILGSLKKLVTGMVSTKSIGGPISIARYAGASADAGWQSFLMFMAALSVMLGVVNLLPIPLLDGGHLLFYVIEAVKGSPLNDAVQGAAMRFGMVFLFGVMLLALYNDFARL
jgi:regulator of sigma E protease